MCAGSGLYSLMRRIRGYSKAGNDIVGRGMAFKPSVARRTMRSRKVTSAHQL